MSRLRVVPNQNLVNGILHCWDSRQSSLTPQPCPTIVRPPNEPRRANMATGKRQLRTAWVAAWAMGVALAGCGKGGDGGNTPVSPTVTAHDKSGTQQTGTTVAPTSRYAQPFEQAAITDDIPDGQQLPPDRTIAGKPTGPLRAAVEQLWPKITLADGQGNPQQLVATVETQAGTFEIMLKPDWAPNHVRNFIALVSVGYYEGLCFDRIVHQEAETEDGQKVRVDLVKGGCPLGTGEAGFGHIGYFLKPEPPVHLKHEEGTVGAWPDARPGSAGCRFYITLGPAPTIDGEFALIGKVTRGLNVVKEIAASPVVDPKSYPEGERPVEPVGIKKITVAAPAYNQP